MPRRRDATVRESGGELHRAGGASLLRRAADRDDIADQVAALLQADSITGQTLVNDAGRLFH